jgi:two-component system, OmpR family, KDP operon response regulator KdpE
MNPKVLLVDRTDAYATVVSTALEQRHFQVRVAATSAAALDAVSQWQPHIVVADSAPAELDGITLCANIRTTGLTPVIVMSATHDEDVALDAFAAGADDHIVKPCSPDQLAARIRVALRRNGMVPGRPTMAVGNFQIDFGERRVRFDGSPIRLTPKEFDLFVFMARNPNRVLTHKTLLSHVWGPRSEEQPEYLRVFVGQLRKKLDSPSNPQYIVTEPWVGYRFNPTGSARASSVS